MVNTEALSLNIMRLASSFKPVVLVWNRGNGVTPLSQRSVNAFSAHIQRFAKDCMSRQVCKDVFKEHTPLNSYITQPNCVQCL